MNHSNSFIPRGILVCLLLGAFSVCAAAKLGPVALHELLQKGDDARALKEIRNSFGSWGLTNPKAKARLEKTTVVWAVDSKEPVTIVDGDGKSLGDLKRLAGSDVQVLSIEFPNATLLDYETRVGGKKFRSGSFKIEHYDYTPDSFEQPGVPKGMVEKRVWKSQIFTNTVRDFVIYVPAQYKTDKPACVMVFQDGLRHADPKGTLRATTVMDNLIHQGKMPVTIGIFINPGSFLNQPEGSKPRNRSFEYDIPSDLYSRFLLEEILPEVGKDYNLRTDPGSRAIAGGSSGGICAWTVAWERPDQFHRVVSWVGSFTNIRGGHVYPNLIRKTERKPIKVCLLDGTNDVVNAHGSWPIANMKMDAALKYANYDYKFIWGPCFHGSKHAGAMLPEMLTWVWSDWTP